MDPWSSVGCVSSCWTHIIPKFRLVDHSITCLSIQFLILIMGYAIKYVNVQLHILLLKSFWNTNVVYGQIEKVLYGSSLM